MNTSRAIFAVFSMAFLIGSCASNASNYQPDLTEENARVRVATLGLENGNTGVVQGANEVEIMKVSDHQCSEPEKVSWIGNFAFTMRGFKTLGIPLANLKKGQFEELYMKVGEPAILMFKGKASEPGALSQAFSRCRSLVEFTPRSGQDYEVTFRHTSFSTCHVELVEISGAGEEAMRSDAVPLVEIGIGNECQAMFNERWY